jgi:hypothetical protein
MPIEASGYNTLFETMQTCRSENIFGTLMVKKKYLEQILKQLSITTKSTTIFPVFPAEIL